MTWINIIEITATDDTADKMPSYYQPEKGLLRIPHLPVRYIITYSLYVSAAKWVRPALTWMASGWRSDNGTLLDTTDIGVGIVAGIFSPRMYAS